MTTSSIRWRWLTGMYLYTAAGAGLVGIALIGFPAGVVRWLAMPDQDPLVLGVVGSAYLAFACVALLGLRRPLTFVPVLLLQLVYKSLWLATVFLPLAAAGRPPGYAVLFAVVFASYVVGDLIAIPFPHLLSRVQPAPRP